MSVIRKYQTMEIRECSNCHNVVKVPVGSPRVQCPQCGGVMLSRSGNETLAKVSDFEAIRKKLDMSVGEFYAIPREPPSASKLPIYDEPHLRNAMARFSQIKGVTPEEKAKAVKRIIAKAKKFGIDPSGFAAKYAK